MDKRPYQITERDFVNIYDENDVCENVLKQIRKMFLDSRDLGMSFTEMLPIHISINPCGDEPEFLLKSVSMRVKRG